MCQGKWIHAYIKSIKKNNRPLILSISKEGEKIWGRIDMKGIKKRGVFFFVKSGCEIPHQRTLIPDWFQECRFQIFFSLVLFKCHRLSRHIRLYPSVASFSVKIYNLRIASIFLGQHFPLLSVGFWIQSCHSPIPIVNQD